MGSGKRVSWRLAVGSWTLESFELHGARHEHNGSPAAVVDEPPRLGGVVDCARSGQHAPALRVGTAQSHEHRVGVRGQRHLLCRLGVVPARHPPEFSVGVYRPRGLSGGDVDCVARFPNRSSISACTPPCASCSRRTLGSASAGGSSLRIPRSFFSEACSLCCRRRSPGERSDTHRF